MDYPSIARCGIVVFVTVVIPEMLPGKWHKSISQNAPVELTGEVTVQQYKRRFGTTVKSSPDVPNHYQFGRYKPGTFAGSAHQVNDVP